MDLYAAIDILDGKVVRLKNGKYNIKEEYSNDPLYVAKWLIEQGCEKLHIVDLNGAKEGKPVNIEIISKIKIKTDVFCEVGGGIRTIETIDDYFNIGVNRVILGTVIVKDFDTMNFVVDKYKSKIALGFDIINGKIAINGWTEEYKVDLVSYISTASKSGAQYIICTDISRDGCLSGANIELYKTLMKELNVNIIASGGINDYQNLIDLKEIGVNGAIVGKAIYTGAISVSEALRILK